VGGGGNEFGPSPLCLCKTGGGGPSKIREKIVRCLTSMDRGVHDGGAPGGWTTCSKEGQMKNRGGEPPSSKI